MKNIREKKHSEGSKVETDKEADEMEESPLQWGRQWQKKQEYATASHTIYQSFSCKPGIQWG